MELLFDHVSAQRWADFSGDFNAIHFDADLARDAGLDGTVVHGMLALLHIKQTVATKFAHANSGHAWQQFKALFRAPLPQNHPVQIGLRAKQDAISFRVTDGCTHYFSGAYTVVAPPTPAQSVESRHVRIDGISVQQRAEQFFGAFPFVADPWIFVDAIAFAEILRVGFPTSAQNSIGAIDLASCGSASKQIVMQTSHRVVFDPARVADLFGRGCFASSLCYSIRSTDAASQKGTQLSLVELNVVGDGSVVMQVEIGLISRDVLH